MVFYRKYRPQLIDDLDSASVRETLYAILHKDVPHAFLFTGPKGLGKTSTARIVAKVVNCTTDRKKRKKELEPCGECDMCMSITNGTNVDVLEIDAASNRGIDEIRELKEKIRLAPVAAMRKVYIIDEVHMLTTEAFNALLKTLEEPPEHAMFILCTTESHKVPDTILSRCFNIQFKPATEEELVRSFKRIVEGEKLEVDDDALKYIAQLSDRGFRDGVKILEELALLASNEKITKEFVEKKYRATVDFLVINLLVALKNKKTKDGIAVITELIELGIDIKYFLTKLLEGFHKNLMTNVGLSEENQTQNINFENEDIKMLTLLFSKSYQDMKNAVLPQLPLEIAIIEWCEDSGDYSQQTATQPQKQTPEKSYVAEDDTVSVSSLRKQVGTMKKLKALYGEKAVAKEPAVDEDAAISTTTVELMHTTGDGTITKEWLDLFWKNFISEMKQYNHTVAGVLRGCMIKSYQDQKLVILTSYTFHKERLDDMKNREALLRISKLLTGKDIEITVELKK